METPHGEFLGPLPSFEHRFGAVPPLPAELDAGQDGPPGVLPVVSAEGRPQRAGLGRCDGLRAADAAGRSTRTRSGHRAQHGVAQTGAGGSQRTAYAAGLSSTSCTTRAAAPRAASPDSDEARSRLPFSCQRPETTRAVSWASAGPSSQGIRSR